MLTSMQGARHEKKVAQVNFIRSGAVFGVSYARGAFLPNSFSALLIGYEEVPPVFTKASGTLQVQISTDRSSIAYTLKYSGLSSAVTQPHIHFAPRPGKRRNYRFPV
jgi:CHRD domain